MSKKPSVAQSHHIVPWVLTADRRDEEVERTQPLHDVSVGEILEGALGIEPAKWTRPDQMRVGAYLKSRNWERYQRRLGSEREYRNRRPPVGTNPG